MKIINWLTILTVIMVALVLLFIWNHTGQLLPSLPERGTMTGLQVIVFSLACAFVWVEVLRWGHVKPFNCLPCMTGWFSLIFSFSHHVEFWPLYLPLGLATGAMFEAVRMRWL